MSAVHASLQLAERLRCSIGIPCDDNEAERLYIDADRNGHPLAKAVVALKGWTDTPTIERRRQKKNLSPGTLLPALTDDQYNAIVRRKAAARRLLKKIWFGSVPAVARFAKCEADRQEVKAWAAAWYGFAVTSLDIGTAIKYYRKAAELGNVRAFHNLAVSLQAQGDKRESVRWFQKATESLHCLSMTYYAGLLLKGWEGFIEQDEPEAFRLYSQCANLFQDKDAKSHLAVCYLHGQGVEKNVEKAMQLLVENAEADVLFATGLIGWLYWTGDDVEQDKKEAIKWFRRAADEGDAVGAFNLASAYEDGEGCPVDHAAAVKYMTLSANLGDSDAQYRLGIYYFKGAFGVEQSNRRAMKWLLRASKNGHLDARELLVHIVHDS